MQLYEECRPKCWAEVLGQDKALKMIDNLRRRGLSGRAYFLSGKSGQGKTTIARLLAEEVAGENVEEIDAKGLTPRDIQEIDRNLHFYGQGSKKGRAIIINEAHGLTNACVTALLTILERIPDHAIWVFTTTAENRDCLFEESLDAHPLLSRCVEIQLTSQGLAKPFAARAREIAQSIGMDGQPIERYIRLVNDCKANFRMVLSKIEQGEMLQ